MTSATPNNRGNRRGSLSQAGNLFLTGNHNIRDIAAQIRSAGHVPSATTQFPTQNRPKSPSPTHPPWAAPRRRTVHTQPQRRCKIFHHPRQSCRVRPSKCLVRTCCRFVMQVLHISDDIHSLSGRLGGCNSVLFGLGGGQNPATSNLGDPLPLLSNPFKNVACSHGQCSQQDTQTN